MSIAKPCPPLPGPVTGTRVTADRRPLRGARTLALVATLAVGLLGTTSAAALELGKPTVLSQRGQKLKVAVPFTARGGESTSVSRFAVEGVTLPAGFAPLTADDMVLAKSPDHNVLFLRSERLVTAPGVELVLAVKDGRSQPVSYQLEVPAARAAGGHAESPLPTASKARKAIRRTASRL